jgi:hypothetical protein
MLYNTPQLYYVNVSFANLLLNSFVFIFSFDKGELANATSTQV